MSDDKIIKGLKHCNSGSNLCAGCPYYDYDASCLSQLRIDALNLIEQLKKENAELRKYKDARPIGCPVCSRGNFSTSKFCAHCGTSLEEFIKNVLAENENKPTAE